MAENSENLQSLLHREGQDSTTVDVSENFQRLLQLEFEDSDTGYVFENFIRLMQQGTLSEQQTLFSLYRGTFMYILGEMDRQFCVYADEVSSTLLDCRLHPYCNSVLRVTESTLSAPPTRCSTLGGHP